MKSLVPWLVGAAALFQGPVVVSDQSRADDAARRCLGSAGRAPVYGESEVIAATDPADPDHVVAAWQISGRNGAVVQAAASFDGGRTWSAPRSLPINACAGGPAEATRASDPAVAFGAGGRVYVGAIGWQPGVGDEPDRFSALVVASSTDGGRTFGPGVIAAAADPAAGVAFDNLSLGADPGRAGQVYLATTRYQPFTDSTGRQRRVGPAAVAVSRDDGRTWSPLRSVLPSGFIGRASAPQLAVDPGDGRVFLGYYRTAPDGPVVAVQRSDDDGARWTESIVARYRRATADTVNPLDGRRFVFAGDIVQLAIDSRRGAVHVAYADARRGPGPRLGVSLASSFDRGETWTAPIAASPDTTVTAWLPGLAVDSAGQVGVGYLTADLDAPMDQAAIDFHLRRFRRVGGALLGEPARRLDRAGMAWPGDYHSVIWGRNGFRLVSVRSTGGPGRIGAPANPTDVMIW